MQELWIRNAKVILPDRVAEGWAVRCEGRRIVQVGRESALRGPSAGEVVGAGGFYLAPGFIDLHLHGVHEYLINDGPESLKAVGSVLPRYGVTGFLGTIHPQDKTSFPSLVRGVASVGSNGATILGFLLEGPYLAVTGALPKESVGSRGPELVSELIEAARPHRAVFAVSPEVGGICDLLPLMTEGGTPAFLTHTRAGVKETQAAIATGARHATHFYDVFYPPPETEIGARPCGAVEAILADPSVSVDFILDGEHVDPVAVKMALACKGIDKVCLITDANRGAGLGPGRYAFGDYEVEFAYRGGPARFTENHPEYGGTLAGSGLTMDRAVRNAVEMLGCDLPSAVRMASTSPAHVLGLGARKGRLAEGYDADMVLLDENLLPRRTWVNGVCCFVSE
jgi:N-acetylglucosamine-6-phosphate deacetylase